MKGRFTERTLPVACAVVSFSLLPWTSVDAADEIVSRTFISGGVRRSYSAYVPPSAERPRPILILLHGSGGRGREMIRQWKDLARREDIVIVAPDAADAERWQPPQDGPTLLRDVVEEMKPRHIDLRRIYLFGYSAGAVFALYMAPLESRYFAAAAAHAGAYGGESELGFLDRAPRKVPLFVSVGTEDRLFPRSVVLETVDRLRRSGHPVTTSLIPGGHGYGSSREVNERAWRFLEQHRLPADPVFVTVQFRPEG